MQFRRRINLSVTRTFFFFFVCYLVPGDLEAKKRRVEASLNNDLALFRRNTKELVKGAEEAFEQLQKLGLVVCQIEETRQRAEVFNDELLLVSIFRTKEALRKFQRK